MSIVKYKNKKTGVVTLYESTSHYDPVTKQSRPVRKYLGREDPATGELIPSSGKRGRKSSDAVPSDARSAMKTDDKTVKELKDSYEIKLQSKDDIIKEQARQIRELEAEKASVLRKLSAIITEFAE